MTTLTLIEVREPGELQRAFAIRKRVFVDEQGVDEALEIDSHEAASRHLLALSGDLPVGTLRVRLVEAGRVAKIERVAVLSEARGLRVGRALMVEALDLARAAGARTARLHAQVQAQAFYRRLGFASEGAAFIEDGLPHVVMTRPLRTDQGAAKG